MISTGGSTIVGLGSYLPPGRVTTESIVGRFNDIYSLSPKYIERMTGIREKRRSLDSQLPSTLAVKASLIALEQAKLRATDIGAIIYTGLIKNFEEPATAHVVQSDLNATNAICFDVGNACHGFASGVFIADALVSTHDNIRHVLVVTGEQGSRFEDKAVEMLRTEPPSRELLQTLMAGLTLGDAGGAVIVGKKHNNEDAGISGFNLASFGNHYSLCVAGSPLEGGVLKTRMAELMSTAIPVITSMYHKFLLQLDWDKDEVNSLIPHQTGNGMIRQYCDNLGIAVTKIYHTLETCGNLITAAMPVNMALYSEVANEGDKVIVSIQGSGLSVSHTGIVWPAHLS